MEFLHNTQLYTLQRTKQYKKLQGDLQRALYHQWEDVVMSGILNDIEKKIKRDHLSPEMKEKVRKFTEEPVLPLDDKKKTPLLNKETLLLAIMALLRKYLKPVRSYFSLRDLLYQSALYFATRGGQSILDQISDTTNTRPKTFQLTNKLIQRDLKNHAWELPEELDQTTIKQLAKQLLVAFEEEQTKKQIVRTLLATGALIAARRAKNIALTETVRAYEEMRRRTGISNGGEFMTWLTQADNRVCSECSANHNVTVSVNGTFPSGDSSPPLHVNCRCTVAFDFRYALDDLLKSRRTTSYNIHGNYIAKDEETSQNAFKWDLEHGKRFVNPNALWVGGEQLVGPDKKVGFYAQHLTMTHALRSLLHTNEAGQRYIDTIADAWREQWERNKKDTTALLLSAYTPEETLLIEAKLSLTPLGFAQLLRAKGYEAHVADVELYNNLPSYTELQRRYAQHRVYLAADGQNVDPRKLNIPVADEKFLALGNVKKMAVEKSLAVEKNLAVEKKRRLKNLAVEKNPIQKKLLPTTSIALSTPTLNLFRLLSVLSNYNEAQYRGEPMQVIATQGEPQYILISDGQHRLAAAYLLGINEIKVEIVK